jgi:hypothetical protein
MRPAGHAGPDRCLFNRHAGHSAYVTGRNVVKIATLMVSSVLALGLIAGPAAAAQADSAEPTNCALKTYTVTAVAPQFADVRQGRVTTRRLAGAVVQVQAQPGLTGEWLRLSLQRHLSAMQGGKDEGLPAGSEGPAHRRQLGGNRVCDPIVR